MVFNYLLSATVDQLDIPLVEAKCNFPDVILLNKT